MPATFPSAPNAQTLLNDGMRALHSRDKACARELLSAAVALDPRSEQVWLWLSAAVETDAERVRCLEQVLALNPHSQPALQGLRMIAAPPVAPAAAPAAPPPLNLSADAIFDRDRFLLRYEIATAEKYRVWDEYERPLLYIGLSRHAVRDVLRLLSLLMLSVVMFIFLLVLTVTAAWPIVRLVLGLLTAIAFVVMVTAPVLLNKKRSITIYRDKDKQEPLLRILQDQRFPLINKTYMVVDANGQLLARLRKNYHYNLARRRWYCYRPDQTLLCVAKEESLARTLRRSFLQFGMFGMLVMPVLRSNFVILAGNGVTQLGEFNRKKMILDRFVLDISADVARTLNRRVALALAVMLDINNRQ